jgi:hypothetical protein
MKPINLVYAIFLPVIYLSTLWVYLKRGKKEKMTQINRSIFKQVFKKEILFGETLIIKAKKTTSNNV